jgi:hypothetical protein
MARILLQDLINLVKASPNYLTDFDGATPADLSLRIVVAERPTTTGNEPGLVSRVFPTVAGPEVIIDLDRDERVWMIEFF